MKTRDKILISSANLFNNYGVSQVSTNLISQTLEISTGNLYYHFKNKEEIIRELFDEFSKELDFFWEINKINFNLIKIIDSLINFSFIIHSKYKFIHLELLSLILKDSILRKKYENFLNNQKERWHPIFVRSINDGLVKDIGESELNSLIEILGFNFMIWFSKESLENKEIKIEENEVRDFKKWIFVLLRFYLTEKGRMNFQQYK